jgi:hypothetical protein
MVVHIRCKKVRTSIRAIRKASGKEKKGRKKKRGELRGKNADEPVKVVFANAFSHVVVQTVLYNRKTALARWRRAKGFQLSGFSLRQKVSS